MGSASNVIGGTGAASRNIISGNSRRGYRSTDVAAPGGNQIANNYIGLDPTGLMIAGNDFGINMENAVGTIIRQNVISANDQFGIRLATGSTMTSIVGNTIGLNASGTSSLTQY